MKKLISLMLAIALVLAISSSALAVELPPGKIAITAQPVDYTYALAGYAQPVSKAYVANERFAVLVSLDVPGWLDTAGLALEVGPKNCTIDNPGALALATGNYIITGTTLAAGATVKITIKDNAIKEAGTSAELYAALYNDRTVSATATLGVAVPTIPKTGGRESISAAVLCLLLAAALIWRRKHA